MGRSRRWFGSFAVVAGAMAVVLTASSAALAAVPVTSVSTDPYVAPASFHQTEVEPDTYSFGSTIVGVFQAGRFSDGGANNTGYATTIDNGAHWSHNFLPGTTVYATPPGVWARVSDPSVAFDAKHAAWLVTSLAIDNSLVGKAVIVSRSVDGGLNFQNPVTVALGGAGAFFDKEWIACDNTPTSPGYGNCYVEWDDANAGNRLRMSRSTDGGLTWQASMVPAASVIGGQPLAQPNGTVVVPIADAFGSTAETFISTNGGQSYTGPHLINSIQTHAPNGGLRSGDGLVSADVDAAGRIYVAWHDCRFRPSCSANDIVFTTSTNGTTWTALTRIPIAPTSSTIDVFIPGFAVDHTTSGATAHLGVTVYGYPKANCTTATCKLVAGFVQSTDGGQTWTPLTVLFGPIALASLPLTTQGYMVGDYMSTSFGSNGRAFPILPNATAGSCQLGQITSCHEFMVAPTAGLAISDGTIPAIESPVLSSALTARVVMKTAF